MNSNRLNALDCAPRIFPSAMMQLLSTFRNQSRSGFLICLLLVFFSIACSALRAQSSSYTTQSQNQAPCSDPASLNTGDCTGTSSGNAAPLDTGGTTIDTGGATDGTAPLRAGVPRPTQPSSYSDTENLLRTSQQQAQRTSTPVAPVRRPEPLTELQKFFAVTTGQVLPIYGQHLFDRSPNSYTPLALAPVPADYLIGPGDELRIRVWGQVNFQSNLSVDRTGEIFLPQVGAIHVGGVRFDQLSELLNGAIGRIYRGFNLAVNLGQTRAIQVYITGQARMPGQYTISALSSLVDALFASGGPAANGSLRDIQLRRGDRILTHFDLYDLLEHGDKSKDVPLLSGDVIYMPPIGAQAAVTGSVRAPAIYEVKPGEPLSSLIAYAGGATSVASESRISIERVRGHEDRAAMEVGFDAAGLATPVADGDLVRIYAITPMYRSTVTLRGNLANPGRFGWHAGMRLSDLIPDRESLLTRDYWWRRTQLGLAAPDFEPVANFNRMAQPTDGTPRTLDRTQQYSQAGEYSETNPTAASNDTTQNSSQRRTTNSSIADMDQDSRTSNGTPTTAVRNLAPEINWDYAVIERLDPEALKTVLIPFDLGRLVRDHDSSQNLELKPGDVVTIFSAADIRIPIAHQSKIVVLEGEFAHPGAYSVQPGETLRQLIEHAGGLSPNAYLYAASFTRISARRQQQARIDEYVNALSMRIQRSTAAIGSMSSNGQDMSGLAAAQQSTQQLLLELRQIKASGRIVLDIGPHASGLSAIPTLSLEDGDRFVIPSRPENVNVVGAIYNQSSYVYSNGRRVGDYLHLSGGPTSDADRKHAYLIRANGTVVSKSQASGGFGGGFDRLLMYPGDSIVVPEKTLRPSSMQSFIGWSQSFSQMAMGAATISLLTQ